ncbi:cysteine dioxygenase family protein [Comamonas sp. JC664]|uniref:cysteine dioxygenase n=1 Tax=Comamonas sp. JC664 TaxID=2801917 RepID=UPI00174A54E3|nr:cysteine dioxygenase family protein [Comamonas sp. JC664]MBL0698107.1 cysteine dioxygenase family protein [Comamonas sp. JC664]
MSAMCLGEWVELLREKAGGMPGLVGVGEGLAGLVLKPSSLQPYLHFRRGRYTRNLVYRDARLEVLLNCWDAGAVSPIHDHDGQECWFSVQSGAFLLENYPLESGGLGPGPARLGAPTQVGPVGAGHVDFRCPDAPIHRVTATQGPAVSLHVYAGPVDRCLVFDPRRQRCVSRELRYHSVFGRPLAPLEGATQPPALF